MTVQSRPDEAIFEQAREQATSRERAAFVDEACAGDASLKLRVLELLAAHDASQGPLDAPPPGLNITQDSTIERPGTQIGPYKLLQQIGEGGMGVVYMAEQTEPIARRVALKIIKPGMDTRQVVARFEAERQALSLMDHVNIARVLDAGTIPTPSPVVGEDWGEGAGRPYFVMEFVNGVPIAKYCDDNHLTPRQRLELFVPVCQAIQHAHQKGIIHRDIKPSNVMVTLYEGKPVPKVIDFGVAKAMERKLSEQTLFTQYGTMVGTLEYMSPEQAEMSALGVDTRSDIYSLGVLLYELLTGSTPLSRQQMKEAAYGEILRLIKEEDPPKPSTRLSESGESLASISAQRQTEPAKLSKLMRGELDWIVMKSLEKDRNHRYETANGFAADVQRYLNDEPVQACPPSAAYQFRKFARRNQAALAATAVISTVLILGTAISTWQAVRATSAERLAQARLEAATIARSEAETARKEQIQQRAIAVQHQIEAEHHRQQAEHSRNKAVAHFHRARDAVDQMTWVAEEKLIDVQGVESVRLALLENALKFYQGLLDEENKDPEVQAETGMAFLRVAKLLRLLGNNTKAKEAFDKGIALLEKVVADSSSDPKHRMALADGYVQLGWLLLEPGPFRQALAIREKLAEESPNIPEYRLHIAYEHNRLASALTYVGRHKEAEESLRQALAIGQQLAAEFPNAPAFRGAMGDSFACLSRVLRSTGRTEEAMQVVGEALVLLEEQFEAGGGDNRQVLAETHKVLGELLQNSGRYEEAEKAYRRSTSLFRNLADDYPTVVYYRQVLVASCEELAGFLRDHGRPEDAEIAYRKLHELAPNSDRAHINLAWLLANCPDLRFRDAARAVELAKKAVEQAPQDGNHWMTLGVSQYRVRDWSGAIAALKRSRELLVDKVEGVTALNFSSVFLAMAHWQQGDKEAGRKCFEQAVELQKEHHSQNEELNRFRIEAVELLKIDDQPTTQPK